jgi:HPt (histidine-containing phosphotransfer) domain-containing protein
MVQIAGRYLDRVVKEIVQLRALVDSAASGDLAVVREIEALTHRMHGSGAMLQFEEISGYAGQLERMAAGFVASGNVDQPRMVETLGQLQAALDKAVAARSAS